MLGMWLQMPNYRKMMALNTRLSNGFECQTEDVIALSAKL